MIVMGRVDLRIWIFFDSDVSGVVAHLEDFSAEGSSVLGARQAAGDGHDDDYRAVG